MIGSHLKAYALGKAIAARFGGVIFDPQMSTAYDAKGRPICGPGEEEALRYGTPIGTFMDAVAHLKEILQGGIEAKTSRRKKTVPPVKRNLGASRSHSFMMLPPGR